MLYPFTVALNDAKEKNYCMISLSRIKSWNVMIICSLSFMIMLKIIMLLFNNARVLLLKTQNK